MFTNTPHSVGQCVLTFYRGCWWERFRLGDILIN